MKIDRVFTTPGQPYPGIEFIARKSKITNQAGKTIFEADVTAPAAWSDVAVDILAQKYMRKAGVPDRVNPVPEAGVPGWLSRSIPIDGATFGGETDARQVFRRITGAWTYWGWQCGYFDTEDDAATFSCEWSYMMAAQIAAPASPQWFSCGLWWAYGIRGADRGRWAINVTVRPDDGRPGNFRPVAGSDAINGAVRCHESYVRPQVSACFLLPVEDSLMGDGGIMDLYTRESRVFQGGGGSGVDYSPLRGIGEPLSGGGVSSGVMSWLKTGDVNGGAIQSGGTVRRAARLVALADDHPEVVEFVRWKAAEEKKVAYLNAGYKAVKRAAKRLYHAVAAGSIDPDPDTPVMTVADARRAAVESGVPDTVIRQVISAARQKLPFPRLPKMDLDYRGLAYRTVDGQNSNNSVRVSHRFMDAIRMGGTHRLYWRTEKAKAAAEGREPVPCRTMDAVELWDEITTAAWESADPGLIFGDTVNEWNTCRNDGEITAPNPCQPGFARVLTPDGVRSFGDIDVGSVIWSGSQWTTVVRKVATGIQEVYQFCTRGGSFFGTAGHLVFSFGERVEANLAKTIDVAGVPDGGPMIAYFPAGTPCEVTSVDSIGYHPVYDITVDCESHSYWTDGLLVSNCSEYFHIPNTACNLASLNLQRFLSRRPAVESWAFAIEKFRHAARLATIALDITVTMAGYPSREVADGSRKYRTIGLGATGYGACLMAMGVPYDSETGRNWVGHVGALMHYQATLTSAELAKELGTFPRYEANQEYVLRAVENHAAYCHPMLEFDGLTFPPNRLASSGIDPELFRVMLELAAASTRDARHHGLRNAQISLSQPHGTVGLLMDGDTTGIEPDFALRKFKKLADGGYWKLVNRAIPDALWSLGYDAATAAGIVIHVEATGGIEDAPGMKPEHLPVFDCAVPCGNSRRSLSVSAHLDMMAALQPVLSGAISKTIGLPSDATVADVSAAYMGAYTRGLKAAALYVDGCKMSQPLNSGESKAEAKAEVNGSAPVNRIADLTPVVVPVVRGDRDRLPDERDGKTTKMVIGGKVTLYVRTGVYPDGRLGEIFLDYGGEGSTFREMVRNFAVAISLGLQYGVPLEEFVDAFAFTRFEPFGPVRGHARLANCTSPLDAVFRHLAIKHLGREDLAHKFPAAPADRNGKVEIVELEPVGSSAGTQSVSSSRKTGYIVGEVCQTCGADTIVRRGPCLECTSCGEKSGGCA